MGYIIRKSEIDTMPGLTKTHFLNTKAVRNNKSLGDAAGLQNLGFHIIEIEPGFESTEYHRHFFEDECVYILSGSATLTIDETSHEVETGDFIGYPAGGHAHTMINSGSETLRCIVVGQRLTHEVAEYPRLNKKLYRNNGADDLVNSDQIESVSIGSKTED